jgi:hypothetical protein
MLLRIAALERMLPNLRASAAGNNRAPESIEPIPFCDQDLEAVEALLAILEALPPQPPTAATRAIEGAAIRLSSFGERIKAHVGGRADMFISKASKPAGPEFGRSDIRLLFYYVFADKLLAAAQAALDWLNWPPRDLERPASRKVATDIGVREIYFSRLVFFQEGALVRVDRPSTLQPNAPRGGRRCRRLSAVKPFSA